MPDTPVFAVGKVHKRIRIVRYGTFDPVYTPPDFIRVASRTELEGLAEAANRRGKLHIGDIMHFEQGARRAPGLRKSPPLPPDQERLLDAIRNRDTNQSVGEGAELESERSLANQKAC